MSHIAMDWAIEQKLPALQKVVLIMLANRLNQNTGRCDPSIAKIAEDCGMSVDSVRTAIKALIQSGLVTSQQRFNGPTQLTNSYTLNVVEKTANPPVGNIPPSCPQPGTPLANGHPNRELETGKEPSPPTPSGVMGVPAASFSDLKDRSHMIAKAVLESTGLAGSRLYEPIRAQAEFELRSNLEDLEVIRDAMVSAWEDYEACSKAGRLRLSMMGAEKFFGESKWKSSKLWGLKNGESRKGVMHGT